MLLKTARKIAVSVIGGTIVLIGVIMIVAPGPAIVVIPAGLAILGTEFVWARVLLRRMQEKAKGAFEVIGLSGKKPATTENPGGDSSSHPQSKSRSEKPPT